MEWGDIENYFLVFGLEKKFRSLNFQSRKHSYLVLQEHALS